MSEQLWTIGKVLAWTKDRFAERAIASPRLDAELLLAHVLKRERIALYTHFEQPLAPEELAGYRALIKRRLAGEPVAYLLGRREFRSLDLMVDARVLIPRPDTETLVEAALALLPPLGDRAPRVVDVGTGSGAVALAIAVERPDAIVVAVDRSPEAVEVARANAARHAPSVVIHLGDLLAPVIDEGAIDLIVSNPPYVPSDEIDRLQIEVRSEPRMALDGGKDGLELVRRLASAAAARLAEGAAIAIEIGAGQAEATEQILLRAGFARPQRFRDLAGIERVVSARKQRAT
jgi:release factor glutamine methyltransferase